MDFMHIIVHDSQVDIRNSQYAASYVYNHLSLHYKNVLLIDAQNLLFTLQKHQSTPSLEVMIIDLTGHDGGISKASLMTELSQVIGITYSGCGKGVVNICQDRFLLRKVMMGVGLSCVSGNHCTSTDKRSALLWIKYVDASCFVLKSGDHRSKSVKLLSKESAAEAVEMFSEDTGYVERLIAGDLLSYCQVGGYELPVMTNVKGTWLRSQDNQVNECILGMAKRVEKEIGLGASYQINFRLEGYNVYIQSVSALPIMHAKHAVRAAALEYGMNDIEIIKKVFNLR
jgi:hypothetical protein